MRFEGDARSADIWRAAQHRRTEDLINWVSNFFERNAEMSLKRPELRPAFARAMTIATIMFVGISSVSAVVHANKSPHQVALRPIGPMPAVNVP
jgi:hypothetical protein